MRDMNFDKLKEHIHKRKLIVPFIVSIIIIFEAIININYARLFKDVAGGYNGYWSEIQTLVLFLFPVAPIIYGWITRDKIGSIVIGTVPFVGYVLYGIYISGSLHDIEVVQFIEVIYSFGIVSLIGGLEGYLSSRGEKISLLLSILLSMLWMFIMLVLFVAD